MSNPLAYLKRFLYFLTLPLLVCILSCNVNNETIDESSSVYIEKTENGYQMYRHGDPFNIMGAGGSTSLKALKNAGANTVRLYDTIALRQQLDEAHKLGLAAIVDIPIPRFKEKDTFYSRSKNIEQLINATHSFVNRYKNHPALLYWILGNEIEYPNLWIGNDFSTCFNKLIDLLHNIDKNHPVSTATAGFSRKQFLSITRHSPKLDFISINVFGQLSSFERFKKRASFFWDGPYVLSEWGINGPWEADVTLWNAPIEQTSTKKAEQFRERYETYIATLNDGRILGNLAFYWGQKQERTHTWFSLLSKEGKRTQAFMELQNIWNNKASNYTGPKIDYMLLEGKGAADNIILTSGELASARLLHIKSEHVPTQIQWEIRPESWHYREWEVEKEISSIPYNIEKQNETGISFVVPEEEGPYRLFVYIVDKLGNIASANTPFYILDSVDARPQ